MRADMTGPKARLTKEFISFACILGVFAAYALLFIFRTSFVVEGVRYFSLFDDAMISMRYARNLMEGHGLIWNPGGEAVEGYTNFFWVLVMAAVHVLPISTAKISLFIQIISLFLLIINLVFVRRLALLVSNGNTMAAIATVVFTAFYFPLNNWALQGMEVGILATITTAVVFLILKAGEQPIPQSALMLMAIAILTRTETVALFGLIALYHTLFLRSNRKVDWRVWLTLAGVLAVHTMFRYLYYDDLLPNTYYLKLGSVPLSVRLQRGLSSLLQFLMDGGLAAVALPFILFFTAKQNHRIVAFLLLAFVFQCAYSVYVGGDAWEAYSGANRYIAVVMPLLFVLAAWSLSSLRGYIRFPGRQGVIQWASAILVVIAILVSLNWRLWTSFLLQVPPLEVPNNAYMVKTAMLINRTTEPGATVAVVWAGAIPYFTGRPAIDLLGKNDRHIAHLAMNDAMPFTPGHNKWDYHYSIASLQPDVVAQLWEKPEEIMPYLNANYVTVPMAGRRSLFYKQSSPYIKYDSLNLTEQD